MTYVAAWKAHGVVFIVSDTATTISSSTEVSLSNVLGDYTSFSERNFSKPGTLVHEGTLKLINLGTAIIGFAGDISTANAMVGSIRALLKSGHSARDAFRVTVSSFVPLPKPLQTALIIAYPTVDGPVALVFNEDGTQRTEELSEGCLAQLGRLPDLLRDLTERFLNWQYGIHEQPSRLLSTTIAMLQSYGLRTPLLEHGVGGAITGAFVTLDRIQWQADTLTLLADSSSRLAGMVSGGVRGNALVVRSSNEQSLRVFANESSCDSLDSWELSWGHEANNLVKTAGYRFVVYLAVLRPIIVICDLEKPGISEYLQFITRSALSADEEVRYELGMSPLLCEAVDHSPHIPPDALGCQVFWFPPPQPSLPSI
jgi:hypothetical protein